MINFRSKYLLAAQVLAQKDWSAPEVIMAARHMAHDGATTEEIRLAFWPNITHAVAYRRLKKVSIAPHNPSKVSHRGKSTTINGVIIDEIPMGFQQYKPRIFAHGHEDGKPKGNTMKRPATFTCGCGTESPQAKRGVLRTRCPSCATIHRNEQMRQHYHDLKARRASQTEQSASTPAE